MFVLTILFNILTILFNKKSIYFLLRDNNWSSYQDWINEYGHVQNTIQATETTMVTLILYWTPYHGNATHWNSRTIDHCGLPYSCQLTHDRARLSEARVVVFHAPEVRFDDLPAQRESPWVVHMEDPPTKVKWVHEEEKLRLFQYRFVINLFDSGAFRTF